MTGHMKKLYGLNEKGIALLTTLVTQASDDFIDVVIDLENAIENGDIPVYGDTVFGAEHFDEIKEWK